jgi:hypothetical protein
VVEQLLLQLARQLAAKSHGCVWLSIYVSNGVVAKQELIDLGLPQVVRDVVYTRYHVSQWLQAWPRERAPRRTFGTG